MNVEYVPKEDTVPTTLLITAHNVQLGSLLLQKEAQADQIVIKQV